MTDMHDDPRERQRLIALLNQIDPGATALTKQLRSQGYISFADSIRIARYEANECPKCGSDLERVTCPNCDGVRVEYATGWQCGECDEDGEVLVCVVCDGQQAHVSGSVL